MTNQSQLSVCLHFITQYTIIPLAGLTIQWPNIVINHTMLSFFFFYFVTVFSFALKFQLVMINDDTKVL